MAVSVLLADDEPVILRGLQKLIDWKALDTEIIGTASSGSQAETLLVERRPDIFVSDIYMPGKNGIELLKMLKQRNANTKVIFLSGYQEFSYARDAVTYGALDYILKPIDKVQLENALEKAIHLIEKEKEEERIKRQLSGYENESKSLAMDRLLDRLAQGYDMPESARESFASYGLESDDKYYTVITLEIDDLNHKSSALSSQEVQLIKFAVFNRMEQLVKDLQAGVVFYKGDNICGILHHEDPSECRKMAMNVTNGIREQVKISFSKTITAGIGKTVCGMVQIPGSYVDSAEVLQRKYFLGKDRVISSEECNSRNYKLEDFHVLQKSITRGLISNERQAVIERLNSLLEVIMEISRGHRDSVISYCLSTITAIQRELAASGIHAENAGTEENDYIAELRRLENWNSLKTWMENWAGGIFITMASRLKNREALDILKVKEYIEQNYSRNITLETAASIACMNSYYFSSFFKKHTGENFKDFLLKVRMEKALKILLTTDCKVYEIAEGVGFNDPRHFSDMFRKYFGSTPADYKNAMKERRQHN